jgi:GTP cyclohydrolase I
MKNLKIDWTQTLGFVGTGLSIAAMVISSIAQKKSMGEAVAKEVAEALNNQNN